MRKSRQVRSRNASEKEHLPEHNQQVEGIPACRGLSPIAPPGVELEGLFIWKPGAKSGTTERGKPSRWGEAFLALFQSGYADQFFCLTTIVPLMLNRARHGPTIALSVLVRHTNSSFGSFS